MKGSENMAGRNGSWKHTRLSTKINEKLAKKGMTKKQLAKELGINQNQLSQVIYGKKSGPASKRYMKMILEYLGIKDGKRKIA